MDSCEKFPIKTFSSYLLFSSPLLSHLLSEDHVQEQQYPLVIDKVVSQRNLSQEWLVSVGSLVLAALGLTENNFNKPKEELRILSENEIAPLAYLTEEIVVCPDEHAFPV